MVYSALARYHLDVDNYPEHLAPEFDDTGAVVTPFPEWWARVRSSFANVPDEVAEDVLHRHWRYSPYAWLPSAHYRFLKVEWSASSLHDIRQNLNNFSDDPAGIIEQGEWLVETHRKRHGNRLADFILEHGAFPVPPLILDNRNGHLAGPEPYPSTYILIEGHRRHQIASYLETIGKMQPTMTIWLMKKI